MANNLRAYNPFARHETHSSRSLLLYRIFTILSWLLVVVTAIYYSGNKPHDGPKQHSHKIWAQNKHHPTPFSLNPFITDIYWVILLLLQVGYVWHLFSKNTAYVASAANVGSHFIINNLLQFAFILLWTRGYFWPGEIILIANFFNLSTLYFRHARTPLFVHVPAVSWPLAWTWVALFWNGAAMVGAKHLPARIAANVFVWSWLLYGFVFIGTYQDYTMGYALSILSLSLAVHQLDIKVIALQWIFAFVIFGVLLTVSLGIAVPGYFSKEWRWSRDTRVVMPTDGETEPLLNDERV